MQHWCIHGNSHKPLVLLWVNLVVLLNELSRAHLPTRDLHGNTPHAHNCKYCNCFPECTYTPSHCTCTLTSHLVPSNCTLYPHTHLAPSHHTLHPHTTPCTLTSHLTCPHTTPNTLTAHVTHTHTCTNSSRTLIAHFTQAPDSSVNYLILESCGLSNERVLLRSELLKVLLERGQFLLQCLGLPLSCRQLQCRAQIRQPNRGQQQTPLTTCQWCCVTTPPTTRQWCCETHTAHHQSVVL